MGETMTPTMRIGKLEARIQEVDKCHRLILEYKKGIGGGRSFLGGLDHAAQVLLIRKRILQQQLQESREMSQSI
jgi:hypothetical protein